MADPFALLKACSVPADAPGAAAGVRAATAGRHDWRVVIEAAEGHGLVPLLCRRVLDAAADLLGPETSERLAAVALASAARALAAAQQLATVIEALEHAGIAALPYKGPALAVDAYGDAALRDSDDLDVAVSPADVDAAAAALGRSGYAPIGAATWAAARAAHDWQGHVPLAGAAKALPLELHWRFCDRKLPWNPVVAGVIARATSAEIAGVRVRVPERHDQLLLVLLHAARHGWDRLEGVACIAALVRRGVDGPTLLARARAAGGVRATLTGLAIAQRLPGATFPAGLEEALAAEPAVPRLVGRAEARLRRGDAGDARDAPLHLAALDGIGARVRYVALHVLLLTPQERAVVRLPRVLAPLYLPVRAARLAIRTFTR